MRDFKEIWENERISEVDTRGGDDGFRCKIRMGGYSASLIVSKGGGWEHASISPYRKVTPSWEDMCRLKEIVWKDDEAVIQIHPASKDYVNNVGNCLHLWRCYYTEMVLPPSIFVGYRQGQTFFEAERELKEAYKKAGEVY